MPRYVKSTHRHFYCAPLESTGCYKITTVFSHAQTVVVCMSCSTVLCQPTGGRARLTEGMYFNRNCDSCFIYCFFRVLFPEKATLTENCLCMCNVSNNIFLIHAINVN